MWPIFHVTLALSYFAGKIARNFSTTSKLAESEGERRIMQNSFANIQIPPIVFAWVNQGAALISLVPPAHEVCRLFALLCFDYNNVVANAAGNGLPHRVARRCYS